MNMKIVLSFIGGAGIGAFCSFIFMKHKFQKEIGEIVNTVHETAMKPEEYAELQKKLQEKAQDEPKSAEVVVEKREEIVPTEQFESVKENTMSLGNDLQKKAAEIARDKGDIIDYTRMITQMKYRPDADVEEYGEYPYLITKDMIPYGQKQDEDGNPYDEITLVYYEDGPIADTNFDIIDDVNDTIGNDNLSHFGDYANKDEIYVRNDRIKVDFTICKSNLTWEGDILARMPYLRSRQ